MEILPQVEAEFRLISEDPIYWKEQAQEYKRCVLTAVHQLEDDLPITAAEARASTYENAIVLCPKMLQSAAFTHKLFNSDLNFVHERANLLHIHARLLYFDQDSGPQKSLEILQEAVDCGLSAYPAPQKFKRVAQIKREEKLREIMLSLGLIDLEKERIEEEVRHCGIGGVERNKHGKIVRTCGINNCTFKAAYTTQMRNHKASKHNIDGKQKKAVERRAHRKRNRKSRSNRENEPLRRLYPLITQLHDTYFTPNICGAPNSAPRITWADIPKMLQPSSTSGGGLTTNSDDRVKRKQWQLESLAFALNQILLRIPPPPPTSPNPSPIKVVDFGSGSGNSALVLAYLNPSINFTLIDTKPECISIIKSRCDSANISNVTAQLISVDDFEEDFDVGMGVHLCGEGTDEAVVKCFAKEASFLIVPCCLGKISKVVVKGLEGVTIDGTNIGSFFDYPRSQWLKDELTLDSYLRYTRLGDFSDGNGEGGANLDAAMSKKLIDVDRGKVAAEKGYDVKMGKYEPLEASVKNDVILGLSPNHIANNKKIWEYCGRRCWEEGHR
ncbi:hypothetical protein TrLO_g13054 [Triparma laevis f. longispina]|uniref:Methyltransferase domain-containing protein n=1 Tax=Triparma laevis f. longispina TaxID=1714387 RepID=A0A9W7FLF9_9STRA|nr:hypothetical protein TrLO_g13054 [Triparma laevis f. longispina]